MYRPRYKMWLTTHSSYVRRVCVKNIPIYKSRNSEVTTIKVKMSFLTSVLLCICLNMYIQIQISVLQLNCSIQDHILCFSTGSLILTAKPNSSTYRSELLPDSARYLSSFHFLTPASFS